MAAASQPSVLAGVACRELVEARAERRHGFRGQRPVPVRLDAPLLGALLGRLDLDLSAIADRSGGLVRVSLRREGEEVHDVSWLRVVGTAPGELTQREPIGLRGRSGRTP